MKYDSEGNELTLEQCVENELIAFFSISMLLIMVGGSEKERKKEVEERAKESARSIIEDASKYLINAENVVKNLDL